MDSSPPLNHDPTPSPWAKLPASAPGQGILFVRHSFSKKSFGVQVTDLIHVWGEVLDQQSFSQRSQEDETDISPFDNDQQLANIVQNLKKSLLGQGRTELRLKISDDNKTMTLKTVWSMPPPLPSSHWVWRLQRKDQEAFKRNVVLPLLGSNVIRNRQKDKLQELLQEKDRAIKKLLDAIDSSNMDVTPMLPSSFKAKEKRTKPRSELLREQIKGLTRFDRETWFMREAEQAGSVPIGTSIQMWDEAFKTTGHPRLPGLVESLELLSSNQSRFRPQQVIRDSQSMSMSSDISKASSKVNADDDAKVVLPPTSCQSIRILERALSVITLSQKQTTHDSFPSTEHASQSPTNVRDTHNASVGRSGASDESTDDDDNDDEYETNEDNSNAQSSESERVAPPPLTRKTQPREKKPKKIGAIGGSKSAKKHHNEDEAEAGAGADQSTIVSTTRVTRTQASDEQDEAASKVFKKPRLGTVGGRKKNVSPEPKSPSKSATTAPTRSGEGGAGLRESTLGVLQESAPAFDSKLPDRTMETADEEASLGQNDAWPRNENEEQEQQPQDTLERADRKREELQSKLEDERKKKSKGKRRF